MQKDKKRRFGLYNFVTLIYFCILIFLTISKTCVKWEKETEKQKEVKSGLALSGNYAARWKTKTSLIQNHLQAPQTASDEVVPFRIRQIRKGL